MNNSQIMDFQNTVSFSINTPEVSETTVCHWKRALTVFIWLLEFLVFVYFKIKTLFKRNWKLHCFHWGEIPSALFVPYMYL